MILLAKRLAAKGAQLRLTQVSQIPSKPSGAIQTRCLVAGPKEALARRCAGHRSPRPTEDLSCRRNGEPAHRLGRSKGRGEEARWVICNSLVPIPHCREFGSIAGRP